MGSGTKFWVEIFRSMLDGFLPFSPVSLTELCSFWYGLKDLFSLQKLANKKNDNVTIGGKGLNPHERLPAARGRMG